MPAKSALGGVTRCPPEARDSFFIVCILSITVAIAGCVSLPVKEPLNTLQDRESSTARRLTALHQLSPIETADDPQQRWDIYKTIAWSDRQPDELRLALMQTMREQDAERFWNDADTYLDTVDRWQVMQPLFDLALEQRRTDFIPTLIRSYARPSKRYADHERPEAQTIITLQPDLTLTQTIWSVLVSGKSDINPQHRMAAWVLLSRLEEPGNLKEHLQALEINPAQTPAMIIDLQAAADVLDDLPSTREQVLALMALRSNTTFWNRAVANAASLSPEQRAGLALRHLPLLIQLQPNQTRLSTHDLDNRLQSELARNRIVARQDSGGLQPRPSERYIDHAQNLCWADMLALTLILERLNHVDVRRQLFEQADADHADTTSEHGGVLTFDRGAIAFPSDITGLDNRYVMPTAGILDMQRELAHLHFQVQLHDHADYAGPGLGDIKFAERFGCHALVMTFVDENNLNGDFYLGDGTVIDLGVLSRP